jgi:hypothetical protein
MIFAAASWGRRRCSKEKQAKGDSMNAQKIVMLVALVVALVAAFTDAIPYVALILAVLGLIIGFSIVPEEHVRVLVSALVLQAAAHTFDTIPSAGGYVTAIIDNVAIVAAGAALMIVFRNIVKRVMP